ncbi:peptidoglycan D,D-transpeptidase FtsI family protein [Acidocella aminolytica]|uniref:Cell division transpeptidase FtsI n=1 Tax=Acidocella aminolytica 101 = DSM 11237 TaxID=1120923 RepID=A0A0D6PBZ9_9PROT|nr:penicillin-binding protein 2 [Acidocella aminolytica]GAN79177.1 cell division transpeptidase FtsI [Acidocella aminolytica 101 = DSM 11237]GBQ40770.1 cell division protein FtsI [Acidocella aminolytica 101 = DSM 11237]SHE91209.1 cell division protein FtsI (penicillin-binding protein 3) [Acidocella aminolytica 101 = DSM 11237]
MEQVRVTGSDLNQRGALERARGRIVMAALLFIGLYSLVALKLIWATVISPIYPSQAQIAALMPKFSVMPPPPSRADIVDRNGTILAVSLPGASLYANPRQVPDPRAAAALLVNVLPGANEAWIAHVLGAGVPVEKRREFVYLDRRLTPQEELAVNSLGIPGVYFEDREERHYPDGDLAAHILGGVNIDSTGLAGVEKYFNKRLTTDTQPLQLSIDAGIQSIVHNELASAVKEFQAPGACAIVMNVKTGEVLAMVSLPDYDVNDYRDASHNAQFNRCVSGLYEPGSVFKLQTISMALDSGIVHWWDYFDTTHPLRVGHFYITDFEPAHRWMAVPEILNVSSNIGASRIATILGPKIEQAWYEKQGFFKPLDVQLPGPPLPLFPSKSNWGLAATMTVSFGAGIAISPLQLVTATIPIVNGGLRYHATLLKVDANGPQPQGVRIMKQSTSEIMRKMMTNVVLFGTGEYAAVPGYVVGGKTGTAQVVGPNGRYLRHTNNASFMAAFPMQDPQYLVYVLVMQPKPDATTHGFTTGGYIAAPTVSRIIARMGPMLGIVPSTGDELAKLDASLSVPLNPSPPPGQRALGPNDPLPPGANAFAYELMGKKPPQAAADARGPEGASARPADVKAHKTRHEKVLAPVSPMMGSHMTERDTGDEQG